MNKLRNIFFLLVLASSVAMIGCSSSGRAGGSKKGCGCGVHKGYSGY